MRRAQLIFAACLGMAFAAAQVVAMPTLAGPLAAGGSGIACDPNTTTCTLVGQRFTNRVFLGTTLGAGGTSARVAIDTYIGWGDSEAVTIRGKGTGELDTSSPLTVNGLKVPVVHGTGTAAQAIESGTGTLTANALAVTFGTAFGAAHPRCFCNHINATPLACGPAAAASTTAVTFNVPAGTGDIDWFCVGQR